MSLELVNPYVTKILLAAQDGDSINQVAQKTGGSYAYTHEWIEQLTAIDVIERDNGIHITDEDFYNAFRDVAETVLSRDMSLEDAYLVPNFAGMDYRFTRTDAVFIWTKGGYQIGRNQTDYPIFIDINEADLAAWEEFFEDFSIPYRIEDRIQNGDETPGIYYVLFPREEFETDRVEHARVTPLDETVEWMQEYEVNFQPALEMVDEMYDLDLGVQYREREVL